MGFSLLAVVHLHCYYCLDRLQADELHLLHHDTSEQVEIVANKTGALVTWVTDTEHQGGHLLVVSKVSNI